MFEDITGHLKAQKTEIDELRGQLLDANRQAISRNQSASAGLDNTLEEERQAAEADRVDLLSQISLLIEASGQKQAKRLKTRVDAVTTDLKGSTDSLQKATDTYQEGMNRWDEKESQLMEDVTSSRDAIKGRMQEDWAVSSQFSRVYDDLLMIPIRFSSNVMSRFRSRLKLSIKRRCASSMSKCNRWRFKWKL